MIEFLVFGLIVLAVICLWLLIEGRKNPRFLIWFIPLLLVLVSSTYVTYTSILGLPKFAIPNDGVYISHHIDEPNWIYLWVIEKDNIPRSYQIVYSKATQQSLEGVKGEAEQGAFMVLKNTEKGEEGGDEEGDEKGKGFTLGGDVGFYKWEYETEMAPKE